MLALVSHSCTLLAARDNLPFQIFIPKERLASSSPKTAVVLQGGCRGVTRSGAPAVPSRPRGAANGGRAAASRAAAWWRCRSAHRSVRAPPAPGQRSGGARPGAERLRLPAAAPAGLRRLSAVLRAASPQPSRRLSRQGRCALQPQR